VKFHGEKIFIFWSKVIDLVYGPVRETIANHATSIVYRPTRPSIIVHNLGATLVTWLESEHYWFFGKQMRIIYDTNKMKKKSISQQYIKYRIKDQCKWVSSHPTLLRRIEKKVNRRVVGSIFAEEKCGYKIYFTSTKFFPTARWKNKYNYYCYYSKRPSHRSFWFHPQIK
jgi:hypothetical protein